MTKQQSENARRASIKPKAEREDKSDGKRAGQSAPPLGFEYGLPAAVRAQHEQQLQRAAAGEAQRRAAGLHRQRRLLRDVQPGRIRSLAAFHVAERAEALWSAPAPAPALRDSAPSPGRRPAAPAARPAASLPPRPTPARSAPQRRQAARYSRAGRCAAAARLPAPRSRRSAGPPTAGSRAGPGRGCGAVRPAWPPRAAVRSTVSKRDGQGRRAIRAPRAKRLRRAAAGARRRPRRAGAAAAS